MSSAKDAPEGAPEDPELEELLRRVPSEPADPRRREEARRAFLAGAPSPGVAGEGASRARELDRMGRAMAPDEQDGFVAWLASVALAEPARPEAKRRARLAFLSQVAAVPRATRRERPPFRLAVLALAAAAILAVTFLLPEPARWSVRLDGPLALDEREFRPGDEVRLAAALEAPGTLATTGSGARLSLGDDALVLELLPGSELALPPLPELDGLAPVRFDLARGEAYVRTAREWAGNPILVRTPSADVTLSGTVVGVLVGDFGTCVCVAEGSVRVRGARAGGDELVPERTTLRVFAAAGAPNEVEPLGDSEHERPLLEFGAAR
jgi:hypothetical protein